MPFVKSESAFGILETTGFTPAMVALDGMEKAANIQLLQIELNDMLGICLKILGDVASVKTAIAAGHRLAEQMRGNPVSDVIPRPSELAWSVMDSREEYNPLIQQNVVAVPQPLTRDESMAAAQSIPPALGFIETQGFTAVFAAIDTACKAANVEIVGKEKLGGGYVTVVVQGDVAAVKAAIESGRTKVEGLGKLIAAHVLTGPSESVLSLLPKV